MIQLGLFASLVVYPACLVPESVRFLYGLNPMAGVIEGFRWALLGTQMPGAMILVSVGVVVVLLVFGAFYFRKMEQYYADVVRQGFKHDSYPGPGSGKNTASANSRRNPSPSATRLSTR